MLSKSQISFIKSLHQKKFRSQHQVFIIEGIKSIVEFLNSPYTIQSIYALADTGQQLGKLPANIKLFEVTNAELEKISTLKTPQGILALVQIPLQQQIALENLKNEFSIVLDNVQDPGNLGTIIRTADWFGIKNIICSAGTVDVYNPKTVQSTMGSLSRTKIYYTDLNTFFASAKMPVFGALLDGESIYHTNWKNEGLILLGNEGHGIGQDLLPCITKPVTIPRIGQTESLNVAISAAIFCSEIGRLKLS